MLVFDSKNKKFLYFTIIVITTLLGQYIYIKVASLYHFVIFFFLVLFIIDNHFSIDISLVNRVTCFFTVWLVVSLLSNYWSPDKSLSFEYTYYIMLIFGLNYTLNYCFEFDSLDRYICLFVIILFVLNLIAAWEVSTGNHLVKNYLLSGSRERLFKYTPGTFFYNPNDFAMYIYQLLPFSVTGVFLKKPILRIISIINIPFTVFVILKTESRTLLLLLFAEAIIFIVFFMKKRHLPKLFILAIVIVLVISKFFPDFIDIFYSGLNSVSGDEIANSADGGSLGVRFSLMGNGMVMLLNSFGLGVGAGCHRVLMTDYALHYFPSGRFKVMHNLTMELFADYGLIVGFLFFRSIICSVKKLYLLFKIDDDETNKMLFVMLMINMIFFVIIGICASSIIQLASVWTVFSFTGIVLDNYNKKENKSIYE